MPSSAVECYSGYTFAQEPRAVIWQGQRYAVAVVEQRWRTPEGPAFRVRAEDGSRFELRYHESDDSWAIGELPGSMEQSTPPQSRDGDATAGHEIGPAIDEPGEPAGSGSAESVSEN